MIPGFYTLSAAWLAFLIGPLVLFYFLKLKRPRMEIPSLVLWRQVIDDNRVNSPFQRFKRNILLMIQLALLILLIVAAMQPFLRTGAEGRRQLPVLLDCSASMDARCEEDGRTRLEVAKDKVRGLIDGLLPDQELCLVSFSRTARKRTGFTNDRRLLREALDAIEIEDLPSDIEDALRMTEALARSTPFEEVLLLSDGNFPERIDFDLPFELRYERLPAAGQNFGITSLNAQAGGDGDWVVFCRMEGSPAGRATATVVCEQDGEVVGNEPVSLSGEGSQRLVFQVAGGKPSSVRARLVPDGFDALACDNVAFLDLLAARPLNVYIPSSMVAYRHALKGQKGVRLFDEEDDGAVEAGFDLLISDKTGDRDTEARTALLVGLVPEDTRELLDMEDAGTEVMDWRHDSPLLRHVELRDLVLLNRARYREGIREGDFEDLGYEVLIYGREGPLLLERRDGDRLRYHMLFDTDRSTLPYQVGFPVMVYNLVQQARHEAGLDEARGARTGVLPPMTLVPGNEYDITCPDGGTRRESSDARGELRGVPAFRVGEYVVSEGGGGGRRVGVGLLSVGETRLEGIEEIQFSELTVGASVVPMDTERPLWPLLSFLAFWVLLFEWWYFHRRPGGFAR